MWVIRSPASACHQHIELIAFRRPWIDHSDFAFADHIKVRALEGEWGLNCGHDPPQAGRHLFKRAILGRSSRGKRRRFGRFSLLKAASSLTDPWRKALAGRPLCQREIALFPGRNCALSCCTRELPGG